MPRARTEPERTCVACRVKGGKRELIRVVRRPDGRVHPDPSGKAPGRGAYLHRDPACREAAVRRGGLARALRTDISPEEAGNLLMIIEGASKQ
jgi:predicted RNA-binding protein YlxR (DUF448 family)